ncbi:hypothetical protein [Bradyrhizobium sp. dw_78]|uniref:hypothetical protein n=1 Tax=Bradyrhizobium sp. dw_78 TaxID=2719793 RepID=UPI001BD6044A|nr:hypothetical protein [Bradyrhizobium sp. dw_78]
MMTIKAIDPATELSALFACKCGKPMCRWRALRPFRDHIKRLFQAISVKHERERLSSGDPEVTWDATLFSLQMAASLEDASANTAYVDDSDAIVYCDAAWEFEVLSSEIAAKYVAGLSIFNFLWSAYENAVKAAAGTQFPRDKTAVRGRKLAEGSPRSEDDFPAVNMLYRIAERCCRICGDLDPEIDLISGKYKLTGTGAAAELARIYRNHLAHGDDWVPTASSDWERNGRGKANFVVFRMYAVGRLLLLLIQELAFQSLTSRSACKPAKHSGKAFLRLHLLTKTELADGNRLAHMHAD